MSNAPTAVADVLMGAVVARGADAFDTQTAALALASLCLYHGGMALNDAVDAQIDTEQQRGRPIAGGLVSRSAVLRVAIGLLTIGVAIAVGVSWALASWWPALLGVAIAVAVTLYNTPLKRTALGPVLMGACRALNALLGCGTAVTGGVAWLLAPGVFGYVAGLTWFARDEAIAGSRGRLMAGFATSVVGLAWLGVAPWVVSVGRWPAADGGTWLLLWCVTTLWVARGAVAAILQPTPQRVGRAVGIGVQAIVLIDAALAAGYAGPFAGLAVLSCLPVAMLLGRSIPPT
ncbi:MAG: UbiA family prenyltransferase [Planctomycetota bacterium]